MGCSLDPEVIAVQFDGDGPAVLDDVRGRQHQRFTVDRRDDCPAPLQRPAPDDHGGTIGQIVDGPWRSQLGRPVLSRGSTAHPSVVRRPCLGVLAVARRSPSGPPRARISPPTAAASIASATTSPAPRLRARFRFAPKLGCRG